MPSIDRFIWLQQFWRGSGGSGSNRMRIASASPADIISSHGTAWTYWDLTSEFFGLGSTRWLDYPLNRALQEALKANQERLVVTFVPVGILIDGRPSRPEAKSLVRIGKANLQVEIRKEGVKGKTGKEN